MVKGEMGKILAKMAEEARKKAMAEGLAKIEGMLAERVAEREAVEAINGELAGKKAGLAATIEGMGSVALADMAKTKAELTAEKDAAAADLSAAKATFEKATG